MSTVTAAMARETASGYRKLNQDVNRSFGAEGGIDQPLSALREYHAETRRSHLILASMLLNERCAFNALSAALRHGTPDPETVGRMYREWAANYAQTEEYIRDMDRSHA